MEPVLLMSAMSRPSGMPHHDGPGVYAIALAGPDVLSTISAGPRGVIYVGMTDQCLEVRNHFLHKHSGFSTLRRSLGAILKLQLGLRAIPRAPGPSRSNTTNYRFTDEGERALSRWMEDNLLVAQQPLRDDPLAHERALIATFEPPLNLTGWPNPQRGLLKALRGICAGEAKAA